MQTALISAWRGSVAHKLWQSYERSLEQHPVPTQCATSALLWGTGDVLAQRLARRPGQTKWDAGRTLLTSAFGASVIGPLGHLWYTGLESMATAFGRPGSLPFLAAKIIADSTLWNAFYITSFFLWGELLMEGGSWGTYKAKMSEEFLPTFAAEAAAWPPIMAVVFGKLPVSHHLLAVNLVTVLDVAFLAAVSAGTFSLSPNYVPMPEAPPATTQGSNKSRRQPHKKSQPKSKAQPAKAGSHQDVNATTVVPPDSSTLVDPLWAAAALACCMTPSSTHMHPQTSMPALASMHGSGSKF